MDIRELLALEASTASIKKIDQFLSMKSPNDRDYPKAISHLAYLSYELGDVSNSFQLLFSYLDKCIDKEKPTIYNTLIKIYYEQKDYDNALKMIEAKRSFLPSYNKSAYYEDLINYYTIIDNETELRRNLLIYLSDDISDERRLKALITLTNLLYKNGEYELFNEKNKLIQTLSLSLKEEQIYLNSRYKEAFVMVLIGSYPNALVLIDDILNNTKDKDLTALLLALKLKIYVLLGEYRRASIFEAEYEYVVNTGPLEAKMMFAEECIKLYDALNNKFNKNSYEERYNLLKEELNKTVDVVSTVKKKRQTKQKIELNFIKENIQKQPETKIRVLDKEIVEVNNEVIRTETATFIETSSKLDKISEIFTELNNQVYSQFRDYLRQFFINLASVSYFDEAYLVINEKGYKGYHYKKERLYDKKNIILDDSIVLECINLKEEIIIPDTNKTSYACIITNTPYANMESKSIICFPFVNGALMFIAKDDSLLTKALNYEILKLGIAYLSIKYSSELTESYLNEKYNDYVFVMEHMAAGWKRQIDNYVYLSQNACDMFNAPMALSLNEFYTYLDNQDLINYRMVISDLMSGKVKESKINYRLNNRYYEETFKVDNLGVILSLINDVTEKVKKEEENIKMSQFDPLSGLNNKMKLDSDLNYLIEGNKFSLLALNIIDFKRYNDIYGYDFGDQLIFAVGKYIKEYDQKITAYHLDGDKFVISIDKVNDKRTVTKYAYNLCEYLTNKLKALNYRLNIYFEVGVLRYPTDTLEKSHNKIIDLLLSALTSAKSSDLKTNVSCYNKEDYKAQFLRSQLITHISEAIDNNHLAINYHQVVDITNNSCDHYDISLNLSNYSLDKDLILEVVKKRDMVANLERYMIHKTLYEVAEIYKEVKIHIGVSFSLSKETVEDESFKKYLLEQLEFFKLPYSVVTINYEHELSEKALNTLKSLTINQVAVSTSNVDLIKNLNIAYFNYKLPKNINHRENDFIIILKKYCDSKNIRFIISDVNNLELVSYYQDLGFTLFKGNVYKAVLTSKDIIGAFLA